MSVTAFAPTADQAVADLADHPVINEMATELLAAPEHMIRLLIRGNGTPTGRFMELASDRFYERTGERGRFIGTVANAVTARFRTLLDELTAALLAGLPNEVSEARAAELEARQAFRDVWAYGFPHCPLTKYYDAAGRAADELSA
ncbi:MULTISPECIES: hypothetical protein [unclassified Streptomyces]|uniref:hypothetical protein n=1 Tax=unclassified Streptomyces TaxID=2593676 RepID=UPI0035DA6FA1